MLLDSDSILWRKDRKISNLFRKFAVINPKWQMKRLFSLAFLLLASLSSFAQIKEGDREWLNHIRTDHPRMFLTAEDIPQITRAAQGYENNSFRTMQKQIDHLITQGVEFKNPLSRTGENTKNDRYGERVSEAAMLWLVTKDTKYLDFTKSLLYQLIDYYKLRVANDLNITWYGFPVIATLCAYDWIYNDLSVEEREKMGRDLYYATYNVAWHGPGLREKRYRENPSGYNSGLYGSSVLPWYIGLTFMHEGINDKECERMLCNGYDLHQKMTVHRAKLLGKNGGCSSGTIGYGLGYYPYAEYDLIYTFRSAMGIDITPQMEYMIGYLRYMDWIRLPQNKEFGIGDANHITNALPSGNIVIHIKTIANLFGKNHPELVEWAGELLSRYNAKERSVRMTFIPLLNRFHFIRSEDVAPTKSSKKSLYFDTLGHIYMRSGQEDSDTYAVFLTERLTGHHQHFDINNFIIYKYGFRALDSGTRPQPGLHLSHYYARTVAHNCITVRMPNEEMPHSWGAAAVNEDPETPVPNDGGQCNRVDGKLLAYEEGSDYVYIASDATKCYHEAKVNQVVREFVWCAPDIFVIFDRVVSDKASYPKRWLYHTAAEPTIKGNEFVEVSQGGKSICRTLLPKKFVIEKIGGEGKQFWSDGRNWPLPDPNLEDKSQVHVAYRKAGNDHALFGQWRVEVSPKRAAERDHFLHIVQVGDESLQALPKTNMKESTEEVVLSFDYNGKTYSLTFDKQSDFGCKIEVK